MNPLAQTKLQKLMSITKGSPKVVIGVIDGPVDFSHPALQNATLTTVKDSQLSLCRSASSAACMHGTYIVGTLAAKRGSVAPSICPECKILLRPVFQESNLSNSSADPNKLFPSSTSSELSDAIIETITAGARVINLSLGLSVNSLIFYNDLRDAYDYASKNQVIIVSAAGNQGNIGNVAVIDHDWVIPVAACDESDRPMPMSNFGRSIGQRGLLAPGNNITSTLPGGKFGNMGGTSVSAPFVTGTIALLWSIFPKASAVHIRRSVTSINPRNKSIIPPLLDAELAFDFLKGHI